MTDKRKGTGMEGKHNRQYACREAAEMLGLSMSGVRALVYKGILPNNHWSGRLVFTLSEIKAAEKRNKKAGRPKA